MDNNYSNTNRQVDDEEERGSRNFGKLIMQLQRLERQPHTFGAAGPLSPSEIHMISAIGETDHLLMSDLAARLDITKGAVTQLFAKLEKKGLVYRITHPQDARSTLVMLTELGQQANAAHDEVRLQFYRQLRQQLTEHEITVFETCLEKLNDFLLMQQ
ncbi:MarR family winged helix-turn-helix transcriptional regulator [Paenibacillus yanchengensis]